MGRGKTKLMIRSAFQALNRDIPDDKALSLMSVTVDAQTAAIILLFTLHFEMKVLAIIIGAGLCINLVKLISAQFKLFMS